jgi:hypothetical protein
MSDYGFRDYQRLVTRLHAAANGTEIIAVASRITEFVQNKDHNPVYCEALVNLLMAHTLEGIERLFADTDSLTHDTLTVRLVTRHVNTTVRVWRRTMDHNASGPEE